MAQLSSAIRGRGAFEEGAAAGFADGERQIHRAQERLFFENHSALDGVLELAHIARPVVAENQMARFVGDAANRFAEAAIVAFDEEVDERKDVFLAIAQRRNEDRDDGEAVVQILAELAFAHCFFEVAIGGGDDAHVHLDIAEAADAADHLIFEHTQQLGLEQGREFADFIEKQGAAVGRFKQALLHLLGVGECALFVAEEFGFHQGFGDGGAVDGDEGLFVADAFVVDGLGDEILAGAAFALDENCGGLAGGDLLDEVHQLRHFRRDADDAFVSSAGTSLGAGADCRSSLRALVASIAFSMTSCKASKSMGLPTKS